MLLKIPLKLRVAGEIKHNLVSANVVAENLVVTIEVSRIPSIISEEHVSKLRAVY